MRKIIFCLLLHIPALLRGADYYIAPYPTGNNSTGNGSSGAPWATLSYALSQGYVNTYGNTIHLADGSYSESGRLTINPGVSIQGASMEGTIIHLTYHNGTAEDACFYLYSSTLTAGNQSISYLTLDGGNTGGKAILVRRRHNVDIDHITVKDFLWGGIHYRNQDGWRTPPAVYASGSEVIECILTNCSDRTYESYDPGNLRIDGQMNFDVFEVKMRNNQRPAGHNGNLFNMSFCHNVRVWYCEFIKPDGDGGQWNFYGENFHLRGGIDIGWCSFTGVANLNFSNAAPDGYSTRGSYDYTVDVHDCTFTTASGSQISRSLMAHNQAAITFEKGFWDHCHVRRNHIYRFPYGVTVCAPVDHTISFSHIYIESNLLENIGYSDHPYTWGIAWLLENNGGYGVTMDHMYIQNNTITGGSGYNFNGIRWVANGTATNIYIRNNIIYGWDQTAINITKQTGESATFDRYTINANCLNSNGNNTVTIDPQITLMDGSPITYITGNPGFVNSSDFHLTAGSPCVGAGTSSAGVELDLDGISYYTPPSIGCYEYITTPPTYTHTYFVKNGGNDGLDGRSDANAWATIAKVNAVTLYPGDTVLFRRGDTWQEQVSLLPQSGSSSGYVIYSAYGEGNKPRILGSKQENSSSDWVNTGTNLWRNADPYFVNSQGGVGNIIFNNEAIIGHKVYSSGDLDTQGKFYYDLSNQHLTLYSTTNPASYYSDIKCALGKDAVRLWSGQDYVIIESLEFAYWGAHGISAGGGNSNIIIRDCSFKYIGGGDFDGGSYGNAVQFWASHSNVLIERNTFYQIYDAAITPQYSGSAAVNVNNFVVRLNIIEKAYWSFEYFCSTSTASTINGIYFQNNTCVDAGNSWSNAQRPQDQNEGRHLQLWSYDTDVTLSNFYIRNNIFSKATETAIRVGQSLAPHITFDYNLYNVNVVAYDWYTYTTLADWQAKYNKDAHSLSGNPLFVSNSDFHLQSVSQAIAAGLNVGYVYDYDGNYWKTPPSIGCYEYYASTPPPSLHTYYVKNGGNDNADGLSDATAWATIAKVNSFNFNAGDTILFKRGNTWREQRSLIPKSGTNVNPIVYGSYGTGNKPLILGSKQENSTSDWTNIGTNLWRNTDPSFTNANGGVGNLIFNGEAIIGWKVYSSSDLTAQGRFYYDLTNQHLTLYSTSNPASYYTNIECALGKDAVRLWNSQDNVIIENLDFRYWGAHGISAGGGNSNITIRDCHFRYIGGGDFDGGSYGNAVQFWESYSNILIERNTFYQIYDAAITPQYSGSAAVTATNFVARLNIIEKAYWSFEWFCSTSAASTVNGIYFQNNTCYDAGNSWSNDQRPQDQNEGRHLQLWSYDTDVTLSNFNIRNNIFDKAIVSAIRVGQSLAPRVNFDYNLYNVNVLAYDWNTYTTLADWQAAYNKDAHSLSVDPLFVSVGSDYHLQSTSPAIRAGTNVGYTYDFDRNVFASPPSIGVYEFTGTPPPQPVTPVAEFTANRTTINEGQNVQFTDQSTNIPTSWSWNFGDGGTSTAQNPLYTYSTAGTYTVSLRATNSAGYDDEVKTNYITVNALTLPPVVAFTVTNTTVIQGVSVRFYDQSTNTPTSWSWNFGDGGTSSERNPTHIYNIAGTYTVSLRAANTAGYDDEIKTNYITVYEMETIPVADFTADRVSVVQGQAVQFTDLSLYNPTSWNWNFGDGGTSTEQNPIHIYNNTGTYTVVLSVSNTVGGDTRTRQNYINVTTGGAYQYRCLWIRLRAKGVKLRGDRVMKKVPIP